MTDPWKQPASRLWRVLKLFVALGCVAVLALAGVLAWNWPRCEGSECPSVEALKEYKPPQASLVYDQNGGLLARLAPEQRVVLPIAQVPFHVRGAFLAVEDRRFFQHDGVDWRRAAGALLHDLRAGGAREGFSTLTMQLARNVFPEHLSREKTLRRKLWEILLARQIEQHFSKDEILEIYLNQIYFGDGLYGVEAAARGYFGKSVQELDPAQAAMLAALPKAPSHYNPRRNPPAAKQRRDLVLSLMADAGVLSARDAAKAQAKPIRLAPPLEGKTTAPWFVEAVRKELRERFGPDADNAGLRVHTTLDPALQQVAETELRRQVESIEAGKLGRWAHPSCSNGQPVEDPEACLQGMFVALDPRTGDVHALVGGRDYGLSQFDHVQQARRQPGSAFKPFVYATALSKGVPISKTLVPDETPPKEGEWRPADAETAQGARNLREALRLSSNRGAVAVSQLAGLPEVALFAHAAGLTTNLPEFPSMALGAAEVEPLELVAAYAPFANGGERVLPRFIVRVEGAKGERLWEAPAPAPTPILSPQVAFLTNSLLQDVVAHGTGKNARVAGWRDDVPVAGKTGTTNDAQDVWFVGATPELVAGVWLGFDRPQRIAANATGGRLAAPVWGRVVSAFEKNRPAPAPWMPPEGLVQQEIDVASGSRPTSLCPPEDVTSEWFLAGTEPKEECALHPEEGVSGFFHRAVRGLGGMFE